MQGGPDPVFSTMGSGLIDMAFGIFSFFAFVTGCLLIIFRRVRAVGLVIAICASAYLGGCGARQAVFGDARREAFVKLGERMMPLVNAIESYHHDQSAYPDSLDVLVPKYLDKLPSTGMGRYTNYNYYVGERAAHFEGNPWVVEIPAGCGLGFNQFYYFPKQNYPSNWPYERLGKWAYFHE